MTLATSSKSTTRTVIYLSSAIGIGLSMVAAFGSVAKWGQDINGQAAHDAQLQRDKDTAIARIDAESQVAKAKQKAGIGNATDQFWLYGVTPSNLFDKATANAEILASAKRPDVPLVILDKNRLVVGTFDGSQVCDLKQVCKRIR